MTEAEFQDQRQRLADQVHALANQLDDSEISTERLCAVSDTLGICAVDIAALAIRYRVEAA